MIYIAFKEKNTDGVENRIYQIEWLKLYIPSLVYIGNSAGLFKYV